jgi:dienelactone hydrolase
LYSDIFGIPLINNRLLADAYAKSGDFLVYLPDFFKGDPVPLSTADVLLPVDAKKQSTFAKYGGLLASAPQFVMWMTRHKAGPTEKVCMDFMAALRRATPSNQKIGMVGTCWGGKYALQAGLERNMIDVDGKKVPLVDAVCVLHPSNLVLDDDVATIVVPASYGWGVEDQGVSFAQKGKVEEAHARLLKEGRKIPEQEHRVYTPGRHGFSVRGNPEDPEEKKALEDSYKQVMDWMERWL